jgi:hypothetical protein
LTSYVPWHIRYSSSLNVYHIKVILKTNWDILISLYYKNIALLCFLCCPCYHFLLSFDLTVTQSSCHVMVTLTYSSRLDYVCLTPLSTICQISWWTSFDWWRKVNQLGKYSNFNINLISHRVASRTPRHLHTAQILIRGIILT